MDSSKDSGRLDMDGSVSKDSGDSPELLSPSTRQGVSVHAGFPNPAADTVWSSLDLNQLLINHPASTFIMRISGNQWDAKGVYDEDLAVVDRLLNPKGTDLVIWWEGDQFMLSSLPEAPKDILVWGVVTSIVHRYRISKP